MYQLHFNSIEISWHLSAKHAGVLGKENHLFTLMDPIFWRTHQSPFFGFLGVCISGPEEDLVQSGRFLMEPECFIKLF